MVRERIVSFIRENGIKQSFICEKTGMKPQAVSAIMNLKRNIEVDEYCSICSALNVPLSYFVDSRPDGRG